MRHHFTSIGTDIMKNNKQKIINADKNMEKLCIAAVNMELHSLCVNHMAVP